MCLPCWGFLADRHGDGADGDIRKPFTYDAIGTGFGNPVDIELTDVTFAFRSQADRRSGTGAVGLAAYGDFAGVDEGGITRFAQIIEGRRLKLNAHVLPSTQRAVGGLAGFQREGVGARCGGLIGNRNRITITRFLYITALNPVAAAKLPPDISGSIGGLNNRAVPAGRLLTAS